MPSLSGAGGLTSLTTVITVTTDAGKLLNEELPFVAAIQSATKQKPTCVQKMIVWRTGMRSISLSIDFSNASVRWPAKLHVGLFSNEGTFIDDFQSVGATGNTLRLISATSDLLDPTRNMLRSSPRTERRFMPLSRKPLLFYEDARFLGQNAIE